MHRPQRFAGQFYKPLADINFFEELGVETHDVHFCDDSDEDMSDTELDRIVNLTYILALMFIL